MIKYIKQLIKNLHDFLRPGLNQSERNETVNYCYCLSFEHGFATVYILHVYCRDMLI